MRLVIASFLVVLLCFLVALLFSVCIGDAFWTCALMVATTVAVVGTLYAYWLDKFEILCFDDTVMRRGVYRANMPTAFSHTVMELAESARAPCDKRWVSLLLVAIVALATLSSVPVRRAEGDDEASSLPYLARIYKGSYDVLNWTGEPLPLEVYVLSLPDVGNYRASNHSALLDGVMQACGYDRIRVFLDWELSVVANISVRPHIIYSWDAYRMLVEWGGNAVVVNTHDEYLPVPSGYTRDEWVDRIADFMLNRWGTWVHTGGYPLYRVWYENGTTEDWGIAGFQRLMYHAGKENITCYAPESEIATYAVGNVYAPPAEWQLFDRALLDFTEAALGCPIRDADFPGEVLTLVYDGGPWLPVAAVRFESNLTDGFGTYVHSSPWKFYGSGVEYTRETQDACMGCFSTATAIWSDIGVAISRVYGQWFGEGAIFTIQRAKSAGRTVGLDSAEGLLQNALDALKDGKYKLASFYAEEAKGSAEKAAASSMPPLAMVGVALAAACLGGAVYFERRRKNNGGHECEK